MQQKSNAFFLVEAGGLSVSRSSLDFISNIVYIVAESDSSLDRLSELSTGFSEGYWMVPNSSAVWNVTSLRLDSKLMTYTGKEGGIVLEEVYAVKGRIVRKNVGIWTGQQDVTIGAVEARAGFQGTRYAYQRLSN